MQATRRAAPATGQTATEDRPGARGSGGETPWRRARVPAAALRAAGVAALLVLLAALAVLCIDAAAAPSRYVPGNSGGWPEWLSGAFGGIGSELGKGGFQTLTLIICASYLLALAARARCRWPCSLRPSWRRMSSSCSGRR